MKKGQSTSSLQVCEDVCFLYEAHRMLEVKYITTFIFFTEKQSLFFGHTNLFYQGYINDI